MTNIEVKNLVVSRLLERGLTIAIKEVPDTESIYVFVSNERGLPNERKVVFKIRIAHHRTTHSYYDYWIDTSKPRDKVISSINSALTSIGRRFLKDIPLASVEQLASAEKKENPQSGDSCPQNEDSCRSYASYTTYAKGHAVNLFSFAQWCMDARRPFLTRCATSPAVQGGEDVKTSSFDQEEVEMPDEDIESNAGTEFIKPWFIQVMDHDYFPLIILALVVIVGIIFG